MKEIYLLLAFGVLGAYSCNNNATSCQPVSIKYSENGMNVDIQITCANNPCGEDVKPEFKNCESCKGLAYGRVGFEGDCSKFCECSNEKPVKIGSCPKGLDFNSKESVCDFTENAGCQSSITTTPIPVTTDNPYYCLPCDGIVFGFVPFEKDCSKFCECFNGKINKVKQCESGLLFNADISNCDYAANATCYNNTTTSAPTTIITTPNITPTMDPNCNCGNSSFVPYEGSCTKYCNCMASKIEECPGGLYFDPKTFFCVKPSNVDCPFEPSTTVKPTTTTVKPTTTSVKTTTTTVKPTTTKKPSFNPNCDCEVSSTLVPYKGTCNQYCDCQEKEVIECPGYLYFDPIMTLCTFPENVDCPYDNSTTITTNPTTITTKKPTTTPVPSFNPKCDCGQSNSYVPYEGSCTKYCDCEDKSIEECFGGLYFDPKTTRCGFPETIDCPYDVKITTIGLNFDPNCNCGTSNSVIRYEGSCTKYCDCESKKIEECYFGLYFDPITITCTFANKVDCPFDQKSTTAGLVLPTPKHQTTSRP